MAEFTSYAPGTPCWVDLATSDVAAARTFYSSLFGWDYEEGPPETGGYVNAKIRGKNVAGIFTLSPEMREQGVPPVWTTYLASDDAGHAAKLIEEAGGTIVAGPMQVLEFGTMVVARDPSGATFGVWQGAKHIGAELANEPGTLTWSELLTRDLATARRFYEDAFGYQTEEMDMGADSPYVLIKVGDHMVGGLMTMPSAVPDRVPSHWMSYFAVTDADAAVETVKRGGGEVLMEPMDSPYGRFAAVADPQGAVFTVIRPPDGG
jgi:predicted enzyme related to lactoylglutathione lyase